MTYYKGYYNLACTIIKQACDDYCIALEMFEELKPHEEEFQKKLDEETAKLELIEREAGKQSDRYIKQAKRVKKAETMVNKLISTEAEISLTEYSFTNGFIADLLYLIGFKVTGDEILIRVKNNKNRKRRRKARSK